MRLRQRTGWRNPEADRPDRGPWPTALAGGRAGAQQVVACRLWGRGRLHAYNFTPYVLPGFLLSCLRAGSTVRFTAPGETCWRRRPRQEGAHVLADDSTPWWGRILLGVPIPAVARPIR